MNLKYFNHNETEFPFGKVLEAAGVETEPLTEDGVEATQFADLKKAGRFRDQLQNSIFLFHGVWSNDENEEITFQEIASALDGTENVVTIKISSEPLVGKQYDALSVGSNVFLAIRHTKSKFFTADKLSLLLEAVGNRELLDKWVRREEPAKSDKSLYAILQSAFGAEGEQGRVIANMSILCQGLLIKNATEVGTPKLAPGHKDYKSVNLALEKIGWQRLCKEKTETAKQLLNNATKSERLSDIGEWKKILGDVDVNVLNGPVLSLVEELDQDKLELATVAKALLAIAKAE